MRKAFGTLSKKFTHIIIDCHRPFLLTDASILSTMGRWGVLVVHGGRSSRAVVRRAKQAVDDVGAISSACPHNVKLETQDYYYTRVLFQLLLHEP